MPPQAQPKSPADASIFQVIKGTYGTFPQGHRFSVDTLRELNPLPKDSEVNADDHYRAILNRGLALGVIIPLPDEVGESAKPPGGKVDNHVAAIENATKAVLDQRAASSQAVQARPQTLPDVAPPERPVVQHGGMTAPAPATAPQQPATPPVAPQQPAVANKGK